MFGLFSNLQPIVGRRPTPSSKFSTPIVKRLGCKQEQIAYRKRVGARLPNFCLSIPLKTFELNRTFGRKLVVLVRFLPFSVSFRCMLGGSVDV